MERVGFRWREEREREREMSDNRNNCPNFRHGRTIERSFILRRGDKGHTSIVFLGFFASAVVYHITRAFSCDGIRIARRFIAKSRTKFFEVQNILASKFAERGCLDSVVVRPAYFGCGRGGRPHICCSRYSRRRNGMHRSRAAAMLIYSRKDGQEIFKGSFRLSTAD